VQKLPERATAHTALLAISLLAFDPASALSLGASAARAQPGPEVLEQQPSGPAKHEVSEPKRAPAPSAPEQADGEPGETGLMGLLALLLGSNRLGHGGGSR
jgi:hypothetical protein